MSAVDAGGKRGPGRPPKPVGTAKVGVFTLRLSDEECAAIKAAAKRAGKPTTVWAREILIAATSR